MLHGTLGKVNRPDHRLQHVGTNRQQTAGEVDHRTAEVDHRTAEVDRREGAADAADAAVAADEGGVGGAALAAVPP